MCIPIRNWLINMFPQPSYNPLITVIYPTYVCYINHMGSQQPSNPHIRIPNHLNLPPEAGASWGQASASPGAGSGDARRLKQWVDFQLGSD